MDPRTTLKILMALYYPFLGAVCLTAGALALALFIFALMLPPVLAILLIVPGGLLALTVLHILISCTSLMRREKETDPLEVKISRAWIEPLHRLVAEVAQERDLPEPDDIRLHLESVAHVYDTEDGDRILAVGGFALAGFSRAALAGVIAHELGHLHGGDTKLGRAGRTWFNTMNALENGFARQRYAWINPLVWLVRGYHLLFALAWLANMREQEYAADRFEVEHVGKEQCAATSCLLEVVNHLPWSRLSSIAEACVAANEPLDGIFAEQVRRARSTPIVDWNDALTKALKQKTGLFDTHPCLKDRLKAVGVSSKRARQLASPPTGEPLAEQLHFWPQIEKKMTVQILTLYREWYQAKMEFAQIVVGRPVSWR